MVTDMKELRDCRFRGFEGKTFEERTGSGNAEVASSLPQASERGALRRATYVLQNLGAGVV